MVHEIAGSGFDTAKAEIDFGFQLDPDTVVLGGDMKLLDLGFLTISRPQDRFDKFSHRHGLGEQDFSSLRVRTGWFACLTPAARDSRSLATRSTPSSLSPVVHKGQFWLQTFAQAMSPCSISPPAPPATRQRGR